MFCKIGKNRKIKNIAQLTGKLLCQGLFFWIKLQVEACNFIGKETPAQVFPVSFVNVFLNFFYRTPLVAAFVLQRVYPYK